MAQFYTFGDSIGGSGAQLQNLYQNRDLGDQRLLAMQMQANRDRQAQENFEVQRRERSALASQELAQRAAEGQGRLDYQNRKLNLDREYQNWLMNQPQKADIAAAKDLLKKKADGLHNLVENRLPIHWEDFADLPVEIVNPLREADTALRTREIADIKVAQEAADAGRRLRIINQRASELDKAAKEAPSRNPLVGLLGIGGAMVGASRAGAASVTGQTPPADMAKSLRERAQPFVQRYSQFLDPKQGFVMPDPATGNFNVHPDLIKPWMVGTNAPRGLNMATPATAVAPVAPAGPSGPPRPINLAPATATGTNGTVRVQMPDGVIWKLPATNSAAAVSMGGTLLPP